MAIDIRIALHHAAGGVVGVGQNQQLGAGCDGVFQLFGPEAELVLRTGGNVHRHAAGEGGDRLVADEAGFRDDDLVPRLHQRADGKVDGLAAAHRDQDLVLLAVMQVKPAGQIVADLHPQLLHARVGGVAGAALLQGADGRVPHAPGRFEVRLAHAQRDALRHLGGQIEKLADPGRTHLLGRRRKQRIIIHHSTVHSLSSISSSWNSTPPRL